MSLIYEGKRRKSFVYPIMFFVLFFLMFLGNMFYLRARIDSIVTQEAIQCAAEYADPNLSAFEENIPTATDGETLTADLYRYINIFESGNAQGTVSGNLANTIGEESGYFEGMSPECVNIKEHRVKNYVIYQTYVVEASYELRMPIKFWFSDDYLTLDMTSRAEVPVTDTAEFIRNVDLAVDLVERTETGTKLTERINDTYAKVDNFLNDKGYASGSSGAVAGGATGGKVDYESLTVEEKQAKADEAAKNFNAATNEITMELVLTDAHRATYPHSGGCAQYKAATGKAYK